MKKVVITCLMCMIVFYSYGASTNAAGNRNEKTNKVEMTTLYLGQTSITISKHTDENLFFQNYLDCTVRGRLKFTDNDGNSQTFEGEITIVGISCVELLKQMRKKQ